MVSVLTLKSLVHFGFILVCGVRRWSSFMVFCMYHFQASKIQEFQQRVRISPEHLCSNVKCWTRPYKKSFPLCHLILFLPRPYPQDLFLYIFSRLVMALLARCQSSHDQWCSSSHAKNCTDCSYWSRCNEGKLRTDLQEDKHHLWWSRVARWSEAAVF